MGFSDTAARAPHGKLSGCRRSFHRVREGIKPT